MRSALPVLLIIRAKFRIDTAQWCPSPAHYQGCFRFGHQDSCELPPAVPSPPPCQPCRDNRRELAFSAFRLDCPHANPPATSVDRNAETSPHTPPVRSRRFPPSTSV